MKKTVSFLVAGLVAFSAVSSAVAIFALSDNEAPSVGANDSMPALGITEISADAVPVQFASLKGADDPVRVTADVFEFLEIHNYGKVAVDLNEYKFTINHNGKDYTNPWKFEEGNDGVIEPNETFVIFNYLTASYNYGPNKECFLYHDTAENLAKTWEAFNTFYGINVPVQNRVLALQADETGTAISGAAALPEKGDVVVSIVGNESGNVIATASYGIASKSLSHNYLYDYKTGVSEFYAENGVTPYKLLREQDESYSATYNFDGEKIRVVSQNMLFTDKGEFKARKVCFLDFLATYSPDIIAMQEVTFGWSSYLQEVLPSLGYTYVSGISERGGETPVDGGDSSNPIVYKTAKFDLLEKGGVYATVDGTNNTTYTVEENGEIVEKNNKWDCINRFRTINYAVLQLKGSEKILNVMSTHGYLTGNESRMGQTEVAKKLGDQLQAKYENSVSAFMGDMNYEEGSKYYQNMVSGGYLDSKYLAKNTTYRVTAGYFGQYSYGVTDYSNPWDQEAEIIDFVFLKGTTQVENYKVIDQKYDNADFDTAYPKPSMTCHLSDHAGVLVDFYL